MCVADSKQRVLSLYVSRDIHLPRPFLETLFFMHATPPVLLLNLLPTQFLFPVSGCMDERAQNYNPEATFDNGLCRLGQLCFGLRM